MRECKANFRSYYKESQEIFCTLCTEKKIDNQQHVLECKMLSKHCKSEKLVKNKILYEDIFEDTNKQKNITDLFMQLLQIKNALSKEDYSSTLQNNSCKALKNGYNLQTLYC